MSINRSAPVQIQGNVYGTGNFSTIQTIGTSLWNDISAGTSYSLGITRLGSLMAWGDNSLLQSASAAPYYWSKISSGSDQTLAIRNDGALFAWGNNSTGQVGDGTIVSRSVPVQIAFGSWSQVATSNSFSMAIRSDGSLFTWGYNAFGQLGHNTNINRSSPTQVGVSKYSQIAAGQYHSLAIDTAGNLWGSGLNNKLQLSNNAVPLGMSWISIAGGADTSTGGSVEASGYTLGVRSDNKLFFWGQSISGQSGINVGGFVTYSSPVQIGTNNWSSVSAVNGSCYGIEGGFNLFVWGLNNVGQLGLGDTINRSSPVQIPSITYGWRKVSSGFGSHVVAVNTDRNLFAWGLNNVGQLGDGTTINRSSPVQIGTNTWTEALETACGLGHTIVQEALGFSIVYSWGLNSSGQLGNGTTINRSSPIQLNTGFGSGISNAQSISAGLTHTLVIGESGSNVGLWVFGGNTSGELGTNNTNPVSTPLFLRPITSTQNTEVITMMGGVAPVNTSSMLYDSGTQTLFAWGNNSQGQLGDNTGINRSSPVQIGTVGQFNPTFIRRGGLTGVYASNTTTGFQYYWGSNFARQLDNTATNTFISPTLWYTSGYSSPVQISTGSWSQIAAGEIHSMATRPNGTLFTWGSNIFGQLGVPVPYSLISWNQQSGGNNFGIFITNQGIVRSIGSNASGQLGNGTTLSRNSLTSNFATISGSWSQISTGTNYALGIKSDKTLYGWGDNSLGQLGIGSTLRRSSPVQIGTSSWNQVSAGLSNSAAITSDGRLFVWGSNNIGQLGNSATINRSSPIQIGTDSWSQVNAGRELYSAIRSDGSLFTWGLNTSGQIGDSTTISKSSPVQLGTSSWSQIEVGNLNTAAIRIDGMLFAWGSNDLGQLGDSTTINKSSPVQIGTSSWSQISLGSNFSGAIRNDGYLFTWGFGQNGELGVGSTGSRSSPTQVGLAKYQNISAGSDFAYAIEVGTNYLYSWGVNSNSQLGDGTTINKSAPVLIAIVNPDLLVSAPVQVNSLSYSVINTVANTSFGITNNYLFAWGLNNAGQIGDGTTVNKSLPVQISGSYISVGAGLMHTVAVGQDTRLYTWGSNNNNQLIINFPSISAGGSVTSIIGNNGLFVTGNGSLGLLGNDTTDVISNPIQIGVNFWSSVSVGEHQLAITSSGSLFVWGPNNVGQLGDGTTINKSSPVQLGTSSWSQVTSNGTSYSLAIRSDGGLFVWGLNTTGQLGDGTAINKSSPVQIGTSSWSQVAAGGSTSAAIRSDGALFAWGSGFAGALGENTSTNTDRSSPIQIGTSSWTQVSVGGGFVGAIRNDGSLFMWGQGGSGRLGVGSTVNRSSPTQVTVTSSSWTQVSLGFDHALGLLTDRQVVYVWGNNTQGQLGINSTVSQTVPTTILFSATGWSRISAGLSYSVAAGQSGTASTGRLGIWSWGVGGGGQLGNGTSINRSSPVQVTLPTWIPSLMDSNSYSDTTVGFITSFAKNTQGLLYGWGNNSSGALGINSLSNQLSVATAPQTPTVVSSPVQIGTSSWVAVSAGTDSSMAIRQGNTLFAWGQNTSGKLGNNTANVISSPTQIGTGKWQEISSGGTFSLGVYKSN